MHLAAFFVALTSIFVLSYLYFRLIGWHPRNAVALREDVRRFTRAKRYGKRTRERTYKRPISRA